jgi:hypothetical protein
MTPSNGRTIAKFVLVATLSTGLLAGCSMFSWIGGGGGKKGQEASERYDDAPITEETGSIPGDRSQATYTNKEPQNQ